MKKTNRYYVPTFAELLDRMSICILKKIWIPENAVEYQNEIDLIKSDINAIMEDKDGMQLFNADMIEASMIVMLSNRVIWENESKARQGGTEQDKLLKFTHSINGVRNTAKNIISYNFGDRTDLKIDCLASDIPNEFGNWKNVFYTEDITVMDDEYDEDTDKSNEIYDEIPIDDIINELENKIVFNNIPKSDDTIYYTSTTHPILKFDVDKNIKYTRNSKTDNND